MKNRVTITGDIEIGRLPGVVHISMLTPISRLEQIGIAHLVKENSVYKIITAVPIKRRDQA